MSPNRAETSRTLALSLSRRSFLVKAGLGALGSLLAPLQAEPQIQAVVLAVELDLAKNLYEKGIDYVAGAFLENLFNEPKPVDREFISEAVTGIESKIAGLEAKIDQQNLDRMGSELEAIQNTFATYAALPPQLRERNKSLLQECDSKSAGLLALSKRYEQAFFLSTTVLAYRLLTRFALFQLDSLSGVSAQAWVTSLVSSGEMQSYFEWANASRARLVASLAPQYAISCNRHQEYLPFAAPKTDCDILRANVKISNTDVMSWGSESDQSAQHIFDTTNQSALAYVYNLPDYKSDRATWVEVKKKSSEQISLGADCMSRMYTKASGWPCPPLLRSSHQLNAIQLLHCQTVSATNWKCKVP